MALNKEIKSSRLLYDRLNPAAIVCPPTDVSKLPNQANSTNPPEGNAMAPEFPNLVPLR